jgi:plastocyanin
MKRLLPVFLVAVALTALGACSSSGGGSEPAKTVTDGKITVGAYDTHFDVGDIKTTPGPLAVTLVNHGALQHAFKIDGTTLDLKTSGGKSASGTVTLAKGTYNYECTVAGHKALGMKGKVIVG